MKPVYNLAGLMRKLNVDSFSELQERGYDVRSYLEQREQELSDELEAIRHGLQELDARDEELERSRTQSELNEEYNNPYRRISPYPTNASSPYPQQRAYSNNDDDDIPFSSPRASSRKDNSYDGDDTDLPSNFGFDPSGIDSDSDYIYIGT